MTSPIVTTREGGNVLTKVLVEPQQLQQPKSLLSYSLGGVAAMTAACFTHPLDLLKVRLQTSRAENLRLFPAIKKILYIDGVRGLYSGISGGLMREGTYSTVRFGCYHYLKDQATKDGQTLSLGENIALSLVGGAVGGFVGNPADVVNVRMQADGRLPQENRRNYKHAIDGIVRIRRDEGAASLMRGVRPNVIRAMLLTSGQIASYDLFKTALLKSNYFDDSTVTHFLSSMMAGLVATTACAPADVVKTRLMNSKDGEYRGAVDCFLKATSQEGVRGLFKGWLPAYMRLGPQTIITFVVLEQLRKLNI